MLFIPRKINVGYQKRNDTYTNQLAYIIYFDEKDKLRKEPSWSGWRDENIKNDIFENIPTSGFVLNKKAGGYNSGWNNRQSYIRVYDPRGFEFEITPENLLYILEHTNSIKGKGLEGEFIYSWSGGDLVLVPTSDPEYENYQSNADMLFNKETLKAKDLVIGHLYKDKDNKDVVYMGKYMTFEGWSDDKTESKKTKFVFWDVKIEKFFSRSTVTKYIFKDVLEDKIDNYLDILDYFGYSDLVNKIDKKSKKVITFNEKEVIEKIEEEIEEERLSSIENGYEYDESNSNVRINLNLDENNSKHIDTWGEWKNIDGEFIFIGHEKRNYQKIEKLNVSDFVEIFKPSITVKYLENGNPYDTTVWGQKINFNNFKDEKWKMIKE